jgi:hypothetical protein
MSEQPFICSKDKAIDKIELAMETIKVNSAAISKITAVHEEKLNSINSELVELFGISKILHNDADLLERNFQENSSVSSKILAVHDEKLQRIHKEINELFESCRTISGKLEKIQKDLSSEIELLEQQLETTTDNKNITDCVKFDNIKETFKVEVSKLDDRIKTLESYKYFIVGGIVICSYIIDHIDVLTELLAKH